jgi:hypothetical protein
MIHVPCYNVDQFVSSYGILHCSNLLKVLSPNVILHRTRNFDRVHVPTTAVYDVMRAKRIQH